MGTLRDFDLADYNCDVYVETGTGAGGTLSKSTPHFKKCYSVDMDLGCVDSARNRFPTATIAHDLSTTALEQWLRDDLASTETVLFFLDAHFPGSDYHGKPYDVSAENAVPLEQELRLIKKYRPNAKDIIICDDARIYTIAKFEHGNTEWLQVPGGYEFVYDIFPDANISVSMSEEGYIIIDRQIDTKKNILVIRPAALGDVIMSTGIVRALKHRHPHAAIDVATNNFEVFSNSTCIRYAAPANQFDRSQYDLVVDLEMAYESNPKMHTIDAYAAKAGIDPTTTDLHTELFVQPEHHAFLAQVGLPEKFVVVHQRQHYWTSRNLPRSFYIELMSEIVNQTGHAVVQIGSNDDFTFGSTDGYLYDLTNQLSLHQTAALISRARAFVGIDGGPMHIAATTTTPIIGLFTSVKSEYRAPRNRNAAYIGIASDIECYGCVENQPAPVTRYYCVRGDDECTRRFSVADVIKKLKTVL
jgi:ADP-heptose:LPS heptosyltransferase